MFVRYVEMSLINDSSSLYIEHKNRTRKKKLFAAPVVMVGRKDN